MFDLFLAVQAKIQHKITNGAGQKLSFGCPVSTSPLIVRPHSPHYLVQLHCSHNDAKMALLEWEGTRRKGKGRELTRLASGSHRQPRQCCQVVVDEISVGEKPSVLFWDKGAEIDVMQPYLDAIL